MKKLLVVLIALMIAVPVMAAEVSGSIDVNYFMETFNDDVAPDEPESYFGMVSSKLIVKHELGENLNGLVKLNLLEPYSYGIDSNDAGPPAYMVIEEVWVAKTDAFDQAGLGFKFGKMEVPFNLDYDTNITRNISNALEIDFTWGLNTSYAVEGVGTFNLTLIEGVGGEDDVDDIDLDTGLGSSLVLNWDTGEDAFEVAGLGFKFGKMEVPFNLDYDTNITRNISNALEIDFTWGLNTSYAVEGVGTFNLTLIEGVGGEDDVDDIDLDTGLGSSLVLNWDTGEDAFEVAGLRLVVGYAMIAGQDIAATEDNADAGSVISIGATYTLADQGMKFGLEYDMEKNYLTQMIMGSVEGSTLIAINFDYDINEEISVGLSYEMLAIAEDTAIALPSSTYNRMAIRGSYAIAEDTKLRLEYSSDADSEDDTMGGTLIALGVFSKF